MIFPVRLTSFWGYDIGVVQIHSYPLRFIPLTLHSYPLRFAPPCSATLVPLKGRQFFLICLSLVKTIQRALSNSPSVYRGSTAKPGGSSKRSFNETKCGAKPLRATLVTPSASFHFARPSINRGTFSGYAECFSVNRLSRR